MLVLVVVGGGEADMVRCKVKRRCLDACTRLWQVRFRALDHERVKGHRKRPTGARVRQRQTFRYADQLTFCKSRFHAQKNMQDIQKMGTPMSTMRER